MATMSISQLANITGLDRRTVAQRLETVDHSGGDKRGQAMIYESTVALPAIYLSALVSEDDSRLLDAKLERARLDRAKRHLAEAALDEKKGALIPVEIVQDHWSTIVINCRARLLAIPSKLAQRVLEVSDMSEINTIAKELIYEALMELSIEGLPPHKGKK